MKFTILVDCSLVITTIHSVCTPKESPLGFGVMKFTITCLFTLQMLKNKFWKDWPGIGSSRDDVNKDRFQPIAIGHLCDSDDLIKSENTLLPSHTKFNSYIHYFWKIYFNLFGVIYTKMDKKIAIVIYSIFNSFFDTQLMKKYVHMYILYTCN